MTIHATDETNQEHPIELGAAARRELSALIATVYRATTEQWLKPHLSPKQGWQGLHWACGSGEDIFLIAGQLDDKSTLYGVDADPILIELARLKQAGNGLQQIKFVSYDPKFWQSVPAFDFIYTRFGTWALPGQATTLPLLQQALKPTGILIAEIFSFSGFSAYPYNHAFGRSVELLSRLEKLPLYGEQAWIEWFQQAGFGVVETAYAAPSFIPKEQRQLLSLSLEVFREVLLGRRMAAREELNALLLELRQYEQQADTLVCRPAVLQITARKHKS